MFMMFQTPPEAQPLPNFLPRRSFTLALKRKAFQVRLHSLAYMYPASKHLQFINSYMMPSSYL